MPAKPVDTSLISRTAYFGPSDGGPLGARVSKRFLLAIAYHNQGSNIGTLATTTKQTGIAAIASMLLAIRRMRRRNRAIPAAINKPATNPTSGRSKGSRDKSKTALMGNAAGPLAPSGQKSRIRLLPASIVPSAPAIQIRQVPHPCVRLSRGTGVVRGLITGGSTLGQAGPRQVRLLPSTSAAVPAVCPMAA
jgi:hypothetical protein